METITKTETCSKCAYWNSQEASEGECRRQPPQAIIFKVNDTVTYETRFPTTKAEDWCGEFSAQ
jgi:hypothetical protein